MIDIFSISTNELVAKMRNGDISSVEVCKAYLERIKKYENDVKAWSFLDKKNLLEKAEEADEYRKSGKPIGPLHGLPIAIKDIIATYDMPTECGSVLRKGISGVADAEVVNLIKSAGAIVMGKTVTTEFAYFDPGKTTNPHDYTRTPGGSSKWICSCCCGSYGTISYWNTNKWFCNKTSFLLWCSWLQTILWINFTYRNFKTIFKIRPSRCVWKKQ